jgi:hypothetical protein
MNRDSSYSNRGQLQVLLFVFGLILGFGGCKSRGRGSLQDALVRSTEAAEAYRIVEGTRAYLPYEYSADGCYARATYMQMELFAANIPSRVVFIRTTYDEASQDWKVDAPLLDPAAWVYHVAPVIVVNGQEMVLDPALAPGSTGGAMSLNDWLSTMKAKKFVEAPAAALNQKVAESVDRFVLSRASNPDQGPIDSENVRGQVIHNADEMPAFSSESALYNFKTMDDYLIEAASMGRITNSELQARRDLLVKRTVELAEILESRNRASGPGGDLEGIKITVDMLRSAQSDAQTGNVD